MRRIEEACVVAVEVDEVALPLEVVDDDVEVVVVFDEVLVEEELEEEDEVEADWELAVVDELEEVVEVDAKVEPVVVVVAVQQRGECERTPEASATTAATTMSAMTATTPPVLPIAGLELGLNRTPLV